MALSRSILLTNTSFSRHPLQQTFIATSVKFAAPFCPLKSHKFTTLPLLVHKHHKASLSSIPSLSMENPPQGYRKNVGICLMNPSNKKIFVASRLDIPDSWQMPQGGVDESEDPRDAAIRELREETGVTSAEVVAEDSFGCLHLAAVERATRKLDDILVPYWLTYDFPPHVREKLRQQWGSDWKGQAQKWFLLKLNGKDEEINLLGDGTEKAEFGEWAWMPPEKVVDLAVVFKKPVYEEVLKVFSPYFQ